MAEVGVVVAVRVRAFKDEDEGKQSLCIDMANDVQVIVKDLTGKNEDKKFTYDHAMWSYDGYVGQGVYGKMTYNEPDGTAGRSHNTQYCDQRRCWDLMGNAILDNAWKGFNNTLFAYGQTGAGKSFSIFGYGENKGIVPMAAVEIFRRVKDTTSDTISFQIIIQMVEIYMEKIQDLFVAPKNRKGDLKIKQSKTSIYVHGARKIPVTNYDEI